MRCGRLSSASLACWIGLQARAGKLTELEAKDGGRGGMRRGRTLDGTRSR